MPLPFVPSLKASIEDVTHPFYIWTFFSSSTPIIQFLLHCQLCSFKMEWLLSALLVIRAGPHLLRWHSKYYLPLFNKAPAYGLALSNVLAQYSSHISSSPLSPLLFLIQRVDGERGKWLQVGRQRWVHLLPICWLEVIPFRWPHGWMDSADDHLSVICLHGLISWTAWLI